MKQFYQSFIAIVLASAMVLTGCDSNPNKKGGEGEETALPKIRSFTYSSVSPRQLELRGNNRLSYDAEGRVVHYTTDVLNQQFTYSDNHTCNGIITSLPDNSVVQEQAFKLNEEQMPVGENVNYVDRNFKGTVYYKYNEKYRIINLGAETNKGHLLKCVHTYDSSTGMISEVSVYRKYPDTEGTEIIYRLEYSNHDNPVAFYPENCEWFDFELAFSMTGQTGYQRTKLLDKMWVLTPEGRKTDVYLFNYDFSADGKLTAVHLYHAKVDENGTVSEETPYSDYTEISY